MIPSARNIYGFLIGSAELTFHNYDFSGWHLRIGLAHLCCIVIIGFVEPVDPVYFVS